MSGDLKEITTTETQNDVTVKYQFIQPLSQIFNLNRIKFILLTKQL